MSLDGKIAARSGDSKWISGEQSREFAHLLRARSDAIMVGINTVLADDPQLTARDAEGNANERQPLRVALDSKGRMPPDARMLGAPGNTLVVTVRPVRGEPVQPLRPSTSSGRTGEATPRTEYIEIKGDDGRVDLRALMAMLGEAGCYKCAGGGRRRGSWDAVRLETGG